MWSAKEKSEMIQNGPIQASRNYITNNSHRKNTTSNGINIGRTHISSPDLFLLLLNETIRNSTWVRCCGAEKTPKLVKENASIFAVKESREVDLHLPWIRVLETAQSQ